MNKKFLSVILALMVVLPVLAQRSKGKAEEVIPVVVFEGVTYALPRTVIQISIKAEKTFTIPGPYAAWADQLLGIKGAPTQPVSNWEIKGVKIDSYAEADPEQVFKTNTIATTLVSLTKNGCLAGIQMDAKEDKGSRVESNVTLPALTGSSVLFTRMADSPDVSGRTPVEQRAAAAANRILKARATRFDIVSGMLDEYHPDGKAYEESLEELKRVEKENLELFIGKSEKYSQVFTYSFIPPAKSVKGEVVFRFDVNAGFLPKTDFSGVPVMIDVERESAVLLADPQAAPALGTPGIFSRIPGMGQVRLSLELATLATARLPIAQYGVVQAVPAALLGGEYAIEFNTETGAVKSVTKK